MEELIYMHCSSSRPLPIEADMQDVPHNATREEILAEIVRNLKGVQNSCECAAVAVTAKHQARVTDPVRRQRTTDLVMRVVGETYRRTLHFYAERYGHDIVSEAHRMVRA